MRPCEEEGKNRYGEVECLNDVKMGVHHRYVEWQSRLAWVKDIHD